MGIVDAWGVNDPVPGCHLRTSGSAALASADAFAAGHNIPDSEI